MSNPFERLKQTINSVKIEYKATNYLANTQAQSQAPTRDGCCCCREERCSCKSEQLKKQPNNYFTEEELRKIVRLYEEEKCKNINLKEQLKKQQAASAEQLERYKGDVQKLVSENEALQAKITDLQRLADKSGHQARSFSERDRLAKQEQDRTNAILLDINREINEERSRNRLLTQRIPELEAELMKFSEANKRLEEQYERELATLRGSNQEMKKLLDYQVVLKTRDIAQLQGQHSRQLQDRENALQELQNYANGLEEKLNTEKDISYKLGEAIKNYEITIMNLSREDRERTDEKERLRSDLTDKIQGLMAEVERLAAIQQRNIELEHELEEERVREKYHIVEVKDHTKEIELEVTKRQFMQLLKEKALFEDRLKKMCKCKSISAAGYKQTLVEYENRPKLEEYLRTHEVILRKEA